VLRPNTTLENYRYKLVGLIPTAKMTRFKG